MEYEQGGRPMYTRRDALASISAAASFAAVAPEAFAAWEPSERYPDPLVQVLDPSFNKYRLLLAGVERLAAGMRWCEGPVYFGDVRCLYERYPQQSHPALGRGDGRRERLPPTLQQRQRQYPRPAGKARHLRARHKARDAH